MTSCPDRRSAPVYGREAAYAPHPGAPDAPGTPAAPAAVPVSVAPGPGHAAGGPAPLAPVTDAPPHALPAPSAAARPALARNDLAVWSLVLGLLGVMGCLFLTGVPAVVVGHQARRAVAAGRADDEGTALAGIVLGWVATALGAVLAVVLVLTVLLPLLVVGLVIPWVHAAP